jgi:hypothetical protein
MHTYPQYRKFSHHKTWFKILSETEMEELKVLGKFYNHTSFKAQTFVDRNLINDMIMNVDNHWEVVNETEFIKELDHCKNTLELRTSL